MSKKILFKSFFCAILFFFSVDIFAQGDILSSAPPMPKSASYRPGGFHRCDLISGGYRRGAWQTAHLRCHYKHHRIYETGYFRCMSHHRRSCHHWRWIAGHWLRR